MASKLSRGLTAFLVFLLTTSLTVFSVSAAEENKTVGLLPVVLHADSSKDYLRSGIESMLVSRLEGEGLSVVHGSAVEERLKGELEGVDSQEAAGLVADQLDLDYVIFGSVTALGPMYSLDFSIVDFTREEPKSTQVSETVDENELIGRLSDMAVQFRSVVDGVDLRRYQVVQDDQLSEAEGAKGLFFRPGEGGYGVEPTGKMSLKKGILSFDAGDLNGDGNPELLFMTREELYVYNRDGNRFILQDTLEADFGEYFLKISVGDADQDGKGEIYLVSDHGERARSTVWEWDGSFTKRLRMAGHLQVDEGPEGKSPVVYFQDTMMRRYFKGDIYTMRYERRDRLVQTGSLPDFEKGIQVHTLTRYDLDGDGSMEFLGLSDMSYLHVWDRRGKSLWTSASKMGGTNNAYLLPNTNPQEPPVRIPFNSKPVAMDIDKNGTMEVLALRNIPIIDHLTNLKLFKTSKLYAYRIQGNKLTSEWSTRELTYSITDLKPVGETLYIAFLEGKFSKLSGARGRIMWFE